MRRYLFAAIATIALLAAVPASSMARTHHHKSHHSRHHVRARTRRFGDVNAPSSTTGSTTPSPQDAGTVMSFTPSSTGGNGGTLTISLNDGSTVTGQVTPNTEIECSAMNNQVTRDDGGPGPSGGGDQGDNGDNGNVGNDQGDDNGNDNNDNNQANNQACMSALTKGAVVREATLRISGAGSIWDRVDLDS
jgi:hypothetical protein